jgi:hypothetical protein
MNKSDLLRFQEQVLIFINNFFLKKIVGIQNTQLFLKKIHNCLSNL